MLKRFEKNWVLDPRRAACRRYEFKLPFVWYHSQFAWSAAEQEDNLRAVAEGGGVAVPGRDGTVLKRCSDGTFASVRMQSAANGVAIENYFGRLVQQHAARKLQALARGWLVRKR